jgi:hypothetical protein
MNSPVVLIVFNRPEHARRVFERIRAARPPRLLIICDGPRAGHPDDARRVAAVRALFDSAVDWPCEVFRDYASTNMSCMDRIASGLTHAFELFEEAVILEDDCLPSPSFFSFCDEMLERYRDDERVMNVAGTNFIADHFRPRESYWFSRHPWTWGWATWRRAWKHYDLNFAGWDQNHHALRASFSSGWERQYWLATFEHARRDLRAVNTWDFQWNYACRIRGGLSIVPRENLVENLGFGADSTHTAHNMDRLVVEPRELKFPLKHPRTVRVRRYADDLFTRVYAAAPAHLFANLVARARVLMDNPDKNLP